MPSRAHVTPQLHLSFRPGFEKCSHSDILRLCRGAETSSTNNCNLAQLCFLHFAFFFCEMTTNRWGLIRLINVFYFAKILSALSPSPLSPCLRVFFFFFPPFLSHFLVSIIHIEANGSPEHLRESRPNSFYPLSCSRVFVFPAPIKMRSLDGGTGPRNVARGRRRCASTPLLLHPR